MFYRQSTSIFSPRNVVRALLMLLFAAFTFCYINYMQCDLIAMTQHVLSDGQTHYNRVVGTVIIAAVAIALQVIMSNVFRLPDILYVLSYVPSALFLAAITDLAWSYTTLKLFVYLLLLVAALVICVGVNKPMPRRRGVSTISVLTVNIGLLTVMILLVGFSGNTNKVLHYEQKIGRYLNENNMIKALEVGKGSLETSNVLTIARAYALSRQGLLNEKLFEYPIPAGLHSLLPLPGDSLKMIFPPEKIYQWLGAMPGENSSPNQYLNVIAAQQELVDSLPQIMDYFLATQLVNKQIDRFAENYKASRSNDVRHNLNKMPWNLNNVRHSFSAKHCREAIVLYQHIRTKPVVTIKDNLTETNYNDFMDIAHSRKNAKEKLNLLRSQYGDTYWWYYYFVKTNSTK